METALLVALGGWAATLVALLAVAGVLRSVVRQDARERGLLLDRIMHLSGRTWTPPPADNSHPDPSSVIDLDRYVVSPEQEP